MFRPFGTWTDAELLIEIRRNVSIAEAMTAELRRRDGEITGPEAANDFKAAQSEWEKSRAI